MKSIHFFVRSSSAFSIEGISDGIFKEITNLVGEEICVKKFVVPRQSNSLVNLIRNTIYVFKNRGDVNYITGDIHYTLLGLAFSKKNILTIHDCVYLHRHSKYSLFYWIYKLVWFDIPVKLSDKITVISQKTRSDVIKYTGCSPEKIIVIPNFVNPDFIPSTSPRLESNVKTIIHVGTSWNKNLLNVIEALKGLPVNLIVVGPLSPEQQVSIFSSGVSFKNYENISQKKLIELYQQADILSFPSVYEGFGLPIIEGFAVGLAVLTSNIQPLLEVAGDAAHFVDPDSVSSIREGFVKILEDNQYRIDLIQKGFLQIKKYELTNIANQYLDCFGLGIVFKSEMEYFESQT